MSENSGIVPISLADRDLYREQWVDKTVEEIKKHKYLNPLYDAAFKAFLSDEQALKSFLNGVFKDDRNKIESVVIKNSEINMIFPVPKQKSYRGDWSVRNEKGLTLSDKVMYIVYDLTKFNKPYEEIRTAEDRWLYLLKHAGTAESLPDFKDDIIAKAINRLLVNRASDKLLKEQAKDMVMTEEELDYLAMLKVRARSEGKAEGLVDGRNERNVEMALDMLADNEPIEKIVKYSHLSMEKVLELRNSQAMFSAK
ncbi:MAG: hypothetical protein J6W51_09190 [Fibrobacter sp.]|nr:hypothetical protein [Fibrobacter sp.]